MRHPMKKALLLLAALTYAGFGSAQNVAADTVPALPSYVYCEIMADHLPTYRDSGVLFDFGQITRKRALSGALFHLPEDLLFRHTFRILAG